MMPRVEYEIGTDHSKEVWSYWLDDRGMMLVLDSYKMQERPTKRHGWRSVKWWDRRDSRRWDDDGQLSRQDVPTPDEVRAEVLRKFREMITIE